MSHPRPTNEPDRPPYAQSARATRRKAALCARATRRKAALCARTFVALVLAVSLLPLDVSSVSAYGSSELAAIASGQEIFAASGADAPVETTDRKSVV